MKTLIVHPKDGSTRFLQRIYKDIPQKTVVTGGITRKYLRHLMGSYDRIICCGHGTINGLCANERFLSDPGSGVIWFAHVFDDSMVDVLHMPAQLTSLHRFSLTSLSIRLSIEYFG